MRKGLYKVVVALAALFSITYYLQLTSLKVVFAGIFDVKLPVEMRSATCRLAFGVLDTVATKAPLQKPLTLRG